MLKIGLTGGIGSGKTEVVKRFSQHGICTISADQISHQLCEKGTPTHQTILNHFGPVVRTKDGALDRAALGRIVFQDPDEKQWLENLLHPLVREQIAIAMNQAHSAYVIAEIPLLIESNHAYPLDRLCVVDSPVDLQLQRSVQRDNKTRADVQRIIDLQATREQRLQRADDVIVNDRDLSTLQHRVDELHRFYLSLSETPA